MRRSILIAVLAGALVGLSVAAGISIAGDSGSSSSRQASSSAPTQGSFGSAYAKKGRHGQRGGNGRRGGRRGHGRGHGMHFGALMLAFNGLADKLDVTPEKLRAALKGVKNRALDRAVKDGTITQAERDALAACMKSRRGSGCDRKQARSAHRKLHRALKARAKSDAAGLKAQLIDDLAAELGKGPDEVGTAARAQLSSALDTAVTLGFLSERGRELALGCWDKPDECDRAALRAEIKKRFRGRHGGGRRGHP